MSGALPVAADDHRRKWDTGEYERLARERLEEEKRREKEKVTPKDKVRREILKPRDYKIDLDSKTGGYYCNVCDCIVKDSINFLDHINGKKHQRNMGMSMRVKKSTLDEVKARFATKRQEMEEKKKGYSIEERMREIQEEERKLAEYKQQKRAKRLKPQQEESEDDEESELMAKTMGIKAFSTSKK
uniref:U1-type domain-containing protein n=1 Tax=Trichuris muris TaxID=70415 RepID=A0A5S6Q3M4_TRIMR